MTDEQQLPDGYKQYLQDAAAQVEATIPDGFGFVLFTFGFSSDKDRQGTMNYVSNARREDVINVLKEFLIKAGAEEDWMKRIK
jgi:hypothetical protein